MESVGPALRTVALRAPVPGRVTGPRESGPLPDDDVPIGYLPVVYVVCLSMESLYAGPASPLRCAARRSVLGRVTRGVAWLKVGEMFNPPCKTA